MKPQLIREPLRRLHTLLRLVIELLERQPERMRRPSLQELTRGRPQPQGPEKKDPPDFKPFGGWEGKGAHNAATNESCEGRGPCKLRGSRAGCTEKYRVVEEPPGVQNLGWGPYTRLAPARAVGQSPRRTCGGDADAGMSSSTEGR